MIFLSYETSINLSGTIIKIEKKLKTFHFFFFIEKKVTYEKFY